MERIATSVLRRNTDGPDLCTNSMVFVTGSGKAGADVPPHPLIKRSRGGQNSENVLYLWNFHKYKGLKSLEDFLLSYCGKILFQ